MTTVPAHSFSAPVRARVIAAARLMPGVCAVLTSSSVPLTTRTPSSFHLGLSIAVLFPVGRREIIALAACALQPGAIRCRLARPRLLLERLDARQGLRLQDRRADAIGHAYGGVADPRYVMLVGFLRE